MSAPPTTGLPPFDLPAITVGAGKRRPQGRRLALDGAAPLAVRLAEALRRVPPEMEQWWAPGVFDGDHRAGKRWRGSMLVGVDADYHDDAGEHAAVPPAIAARVEEAARAGELPGSVYHATPRGLRIVFALARQECDGALWQSAARGACALVERWLAGAGLAASGDPPRDGYTLDVAASCDQARMLWAPRAKVDGVQREAEVIVLREQPYAVEELAACAPARRSSASNGKPPRANGVEAGVEAGSANGATQGKRHVELLNLGVRLARMGARPTVIKAALDAANEEFAEPKPADEVRRLMEWITVKHGVLATGITRPKSDVQLARAALAALGDVVAAEGYLWRLDSVIWQRVPDAELHGAIVALDGLPVGEDSTINLTSKRILGLVRLATDLDRIDDYFSATADGIAVGDEWITVGSEGLRCEPLRAEHRARWRIEAEPGAIDAEPAQWLALLRDVLADERGAPREGTEEIVTAIGETIGLALIGRGAKRDARHLLLVGPPNCGKSTILDIVSSLVPPEGQTALTLHDLAERFRSAALIGVRLVLCPELPARDLLDVDRPKAALTGDLMLVERKHRDVITIRPSAAWFMAANELAAIRGRLENLVRP
jgi:hypothetical protein